MEGKTVEVIVTFNEAVEVKTNGGTPTIGINLDTSRTREAPYARGTDTHEMVFAYTIANGDGNTNRIAVNPNSIKRNGAEVHSAQTKVEAVLDHDGTVVETTPILPPPAQGPSARFANMPAHHEGRSSSSTCTSTPRYRGSATKPCRAACSRSREAR